MIVLTIFLVIILLVALLLISDISLVFSYKEKFSFKVGILCFYLSGSKIIQMVEAREENKDLVAEKPESVSKKEKKKLSPSEILSLASYILDLIKAVLGEFARYARLKLCRVKISIGTDDPAQTALLYGTVSSALYTAFEFLDSFMTVKKNYKNIGVAPDFTSDGCKFDFKVVLKIKIIHLLLAFIHISPILAESKKGK